MILNLLSLQADDTTEARLRQALRDTMGQLRDAQSQLATAQAAQAQDEKDKADLQAKADALTTQLKTVSDHAAASDKAIADLRLGNQALIVHLVDALTEQINDLAKPSEKSAIALHQTIDALKAECPDSAAALDQFGADIQSWATGYEEYVQLANRTEAERAKLAAQAKQFELTVSDRESKNLALFKLANEILERYARAGIGDVLLDKEPFIGVSRVKLQTLVQDYQNKLRDEAVVSAH